MLLGTEVPYTDRGPMIENSIIAAYAPDHEHESGGRRTGIILPWSSGFAVKVSFYLFMTRLFWLHLTCLLIHL